MNKNGDRGINVTEDVDYSVSARSLDLIRHPHGVVNYMIKKIQGLIIRKYWLRRIIND